MSDCIHLALKPNGIGYTYRSVDGRQVGAHVLAWEQANGRKVPAGFVVDHLCHNADPSCPADSTCTHRSCVNPDHLEAVSPAENCLRSPYSVGGINSRKTHCHNGHEYTPENTRLEGSARRCLTCARLWQAEYRRQKRIELAS